MRGPLWSPTPIGPSLDERRTSTTAVIAPPTTTTTPSTSTKINHAGTRRRAVGSGGVNAGTPSDCWGCMR
ncbi:hypothetical protein Athai_32360 [Actinocatenispora thailandica]|uniref:Uncharacterized protein n=1 Tax=Actinocatenispora thailandica TaxID=227318 RepID=A0A7R7HXA4_9ACTN|nr:hypothetical protein Athai_32360 [Actinocatenispora thailandica]